jgi:hypothetical protein
MNDRQFLQSLLKICATNIMADWTHTELSPNEEFEEMYKLIFVFEEFKDKFIHLFKFLIWG